MFKTLFTCYLVHYIGYPKHMDEWISKNKLVISFIVISNKVDSPYRPLGWVCPRKLRMRPNSGEEKTRLTCGM